MSVIPATWEAEARGLQVQSQPQQHSKALRNLVRLSLKKKKKKIERAGDVAQW